MVKSPEIDLQCLGQIVINIKAYRQQMPKQRRTDSGLDRYLKTHLSIKDYIFWQLLQQRPAISE